MRLGKRLQALFGAVPAGYDDLWDLGCDHGRLGMALLDAERARSVHFVDRLPWLIDAVRGQLSAYPSEHWSATTMDGEDIDLAATPRELVLLAGVGADQTLHILDRISQRHPDATPEFLIAPSGPVFRLRHALKENGFYLLQEDFVMERRRGYQLLRLTKNPAGAGELSLTGRFWEPGDADHRRYLEQQLGHHQSQLNAPEKRVLAQAIVAELQQWRDWMECAQASFR